MNNHPFHWDGTSQFPNTNCAECGAQEYDVRHFRGNGAAALKFYEERRHLLQVLTEVQVEDKAEPPHFTSVEEADAWLEERARRLRSVKERLDEARGEYARAQALREIGVGDLGVREYGEVTSWNGTKVTSWNGMAKVAGLSDTVTFDLQRTATWR